MISDCKWLPYFFKSILVYYQWRIATNTEMVIRFFVSNNAFRYVSETLYSPFSLYLRKRIKRNATYLMHFIYFVHLCKLLLRLFLLKTASLMHWVKFLFIYIFRRDRKQFVAHSTFLFDINCFNDKNSFWWILGHLLLL